MKNILIIDSSLPINFRTQKIYNELKKLNIYTNIKIITWNRNNYTFLAEEDKSDLFIFTKVSQYGNKIKKAIYSIYYFIFIQNILKSNNFDYIIASHWDMLFLCSFCKKKTQKLIYDNLDIPTSNNIFLNKIFKVIEKIALKKVDLIILASRFYYELYKNLKIKIIIIENKPTTIEKVVNTDDKIVYQREKINISFIGTVRYFKTLKNLIDASTNFKNINIYIHGGGYELEKLRKYCNKNLNVFFTGRYNPNDINTLYENSDFIWAAYPSNNENVKYAISNKFHECLFYLKPGIFSCDTKLGELISNHNLGITLNPCSYKSIVSKLELIASKKIDIDIIKLNMQKFNNSESSWEVEFSYLISYLSNNALTNNHE